MTEKSIKITEKEIKVEKNEDEIEEKKKEKNEAGNKSNTKSKKTVEINTISTPRGSTTKTPFLEKLNRPSIYSTSK